MRKRWLYSTIYSLFAVGLWCVSLANPATAQRIAFRFEGEYDPGPVQSPEYDIDIGTPVVGQFSYDLASLDTMVSDDNQGFYPQVEPYRLEFQVGDSIFFQTDQYGFGPDGYLVWVENDTSRHLPTRDIVRVSARDSALAASYGIDDVGVSLNLQDLTAQALESDALPTDLDGFDLPWWLFLNGFRHEGDGGISVFAYRFRIDFVERLADQVLSVRSDIKPGSKLNRINPISRGVVPVAILGSEDFDVADIDLTTLAFGPDGARPAGAVVRRRNDVNADGFPDLLVHFRIDESGIEFGDTEVCINGELGGGTLFSGCDAVRTIPDR